MISQEREEYVSDEEEMEEEEEVMAKEVCCFLKSLPEATIMPIVVVNNYPGDEGESIRLMPLSSLCLL